VGAVIVDLTLMLVGGLGFGLGLGWALNLFREEPLDDHDIQDAVWDSFRAKRVRENARKRSFESSDRDRLRQARDEIREVRRLVSRDVVELFEVEVDGEKQPVFILDGEDEGPNQVLDEDDDQEPESLDLIFGGGDRP
jgi:hypothetical protein